ncbi:MAG TPA: hypothetical protein VGN18_14675 [Jatrophihabitans sp.]|jgi:hypothetical protein|uniref:hypothetical protein n=1 Tax=Jatrophihabitans sp. TaxID=1932789 RepID=UPI002E00B276|nr:hypothetical protein [Jatrophihabitans sp.]
MGEPPADDHAAALEHLWTEGEDPFTSTVRVKMAQLRRNDPGPDDGGGAGVREPRRPRPHLGAGGRALTPDLDDES